MNFNYFVQGCVPPKVMIAGQELRAKIPLSPMSKAIIKGNRTISIYFSWQRLLRDWERQQHSLVSVSRLWSCWRNELLGRAFYLYTGDSNTAKVNRAESHDWSSERFSDKSLSWYSFCRERYLWKITCTFYPQTLPSLEKALEELSENMDSHSFMSSMVVLWDKLIQPSTGNYTSAAYDIFLYVII